MMIEILNIKYKDHFVLVELNTGEAFTLSFEIISMYRLEAGMKVDPGQYRQLKEESDRYQCKRKALDYLSIRSRSALEMRRHLSKKGFSGNVINEISAELKDKGYLDDFDFAVKYITYRKSRKIAGKNLLKDELYKKGISRSIVKKALVETNTHRDDPGEIYRLALKKLGLLQNKKNRKNRLANYLKQRGFDFQSIQSVINRLEDEGNDL